MEDQNFKDKIQLIENANNKIFNNKNGLYKTNKDIVFVYTQPKVGSTTLVSGFIANHQVRPGFPFSIGHKSHQQYAGGVFQNFYLPFFKLFIQI
jgi:hypothetical protein